MVHHREACTWPRRPPLFLHDIVYSNTTSWCSSGTRDRVNHASPGRCQVSLPAVGGLAARPAVAPALAKCCSVFPFQIYWSVFVFEQTNKKRRRRRSLSFCFCSCHSHIIFNVSMTKIRSLNALPLTSQCLSPCSSLRLWSSTSLVLLSLCLSVFISGFHTNVDCIFNRLTRMGRNAWPLNICNTSVFIF